MQQACDWFGDGSVLVLDVPLACCAIESQAARQLSARDVDVQPDSVLVVTLSGTITRAIAPAVRTLVEGLPVKPVIVSFGACACAGGPYWDSYSVLPGAHELGLVVDHFIAGCPPPPGALQRVLERVRRG